MAVSLNPYISAFDEGFDAGKSSQYRMAIQFALGGLSYALSDCETHRVIGLECHQTDGIDSTETFQLLERVLNSKDLNDKAFESVTCIIDERTNLLVPEKLASPESNGRCLDFTFHIPEGHVHQADRIETIKAMNAFAYPKTLRDRILGKWKEAKITHSATWFLNSCIEYAPEGKVVFVNMRNRDFDMIIVDYGKLLFYNNFKFNTKEDFAYFLLFAMEQNEMAGLDNPVCFSGLILPNSDIIKLCKRYIANLLFIEDRHMLQVCHALEDIPYQYYHLLYQALR